MTDKPKRRVGRPIKTAPSGTRASLGLRVPADLKSQIEDAAKLNGRSQGEEAEYRIRRTFDRTDMLGEIIEMLKDNPKVVKAIATALAKT